MSVELKSEFTEFIKKLSVEISKEVLLEDLKKINRDLGTNNNDNKKILKEYKENIEKIKGELNNIRTSIVIN